MPVTGVEDVAGYVIANCDAEKAALESRLGSRLGAESKHVAVRVLDVHFESPGKVGWRHADRDAILEILVELSGVFDAKPNPGFSGSLITQAKINVCVVA
jgi:hypothetical protein